MIINRKEAIKPVTFEVIPNADCFEYENNYFIKVKRSISHSKSPVFNAVNLENGEAYYFSDDKLVFVTHVEVNVIE